MLSKGEIRPVPTWEASAEDTDTLARRLWPAIEDSATGAMANAPTKQYAPAISGPNLRRAGCANTQGPGASEGLLPDRGNSQPSHCPDMFWHKNPVGRRTGLAQQRRFLERGLAFSRDPGTLPAHGCPRRGRRGDDRSDCERTR